ncbi:MAG: hypothetical protein HETSPECPRED_008761 [Heterodermia speciosa]|uniref:Uncharacterized protein n=1 Tax=Heterodermia speciosa TaxID=116794 RepID=A0A8H3ER19_9LECA|nr:MAG: hypothetical protein HETSPECPRED_008761 [Heterodermia speciosa]
MSGTLGIGVPVPKMLPVTGTWTLPFASYFLLLSNRIVNRRLSNEKYFGDRIAPDGDNPENPDPLLVDIRAQANFLENVPIALLFSAIAELNGADRKILNYVLGSLLLLRIGHVEFGLRGSKTMGIGRPVAFYGTQAVVAGLAGWGLWLVKGYWGL